MGSSIYLLLGPEEGEKSTFISALVQGIAKERGAKPDVLRFYPSEGNLGEFLDGLQTGDLFSSYRVAIVSEVDQLGKAEVDILYRALSSPPPDVTVLMLCSSASLSPRDAAGRLTKLVPEANRKIFWELFQGQKMSWLLRFFSSRNMTMDKAAAEYLLEVVESNTRDLRAECEKIALFQDPGSAIALETVEQFVYHGKEENAFTLFDRVATRSLEASLEVLHKILLSPSSEGFAVLGGLLMQFRRLLDLKLLIADGESFEAAVQRASIRGKRNQQSFRAADKSYRLEEVRAIITATADCDASLRGGRSDLQGLLLSLYLYRVIVRGGRLGRQAPSPPLRSSSR